MTLESRQLQNHSFTVRSKSGDARAGTINVNDTELETPNLLPVVNFYAGGRESSLYGGGIHRTLKEFMTGNEAVNGGEYDEFFDGVMTSIAALTDYGITRERFEDYISEPIKQRDVFRGFEGTLFVDSGGFKFLDGGGLDGSGFEVDIDQESAYDIQCKLGADMVVNLDYPITPDDDFSTRIEKAQKTAENIDTFLKRSNGRSQFRYMTIHGHNYSMIDTFISEIAEVVGEDCLHSAFDGVALGGLVPLKDNKGKLITAVSDCRSVLNDRGFDDLPLHVLGISSSSIPLLAAVGADSFDSSSFMHSAINGKYCTSLVDSVQLDNADFSSCDCPVCSDDELVSRMQGDAEYKKDKLGAVSMHNLIIQKREVRAIRQAIQRSGTEPLVEYIEGTVGRKKSMRQHAHRVVNESLGGYF